MGNEVERCYLMGCTASFSLPKELGEGFHLFSTKTITPLHKESAQIHAACPYCLELTGCEEGHAISILGSVLYGIRLASDCSIQLVGFDSSSSGPYTPSYSPQSIWGHCDEKLREDAVNFAVRHSDVLAKHSAPERFNRFSNAIRLHQAGMTTHDCDLALLGFIGSLESLFSTSPQELSFRLSLAISKFLGDDPDSQKAFFKNAKELYTTRSKLAHGAKIDDSEEQAAIEIVEYWVPKAESINRTCLKRILEDDLVDVFLSEGRLNQFLEDLLF